MVEPLPPQEPVYQLGWYHRVWETETHESHAAHTKYRQSPFGSSQVHAYKDTKRQIDGQTDEYINFMSNARRRHKKVNGLTAADQLNATSNI
jgi:hypothetical protein